MRGSGVRVLASLLDATGSSPANRWSFPPATLERHTGYSLPAPPGWAEVRATCQAGREGHPCACHEETNGAELRVEFTCRQKAGNFTADQYGAFRESVSRALALAGRSAAFKEKK